MFAGLARSSPPAGDCAPLRRRVSRGLSCARWTCRYLDAALIDVLAESSKNLSADVVLPWDGRDHYLAGLYRTSLVGQINALVAAGDRSMAALVNSVESQRIVVADGRSLTNVNSSRDLLLLR